MVQGIRLEGKKESALLVWTIRRLDPPKKVRLFLRQTPEAFSKLSVSIGAKVKTGEKISEPGNGASLPVHASVSGTVTNILILRHPFLGEAEAVEIESDLHEQKLETLGQERKHWETLEPEKLLKLFQENGLCDLQPQGEALHMKLAASRGAEVLILNACEPEPYQSCDYALMMSHPHEILRGAEILRKAAGAERVKIVTQDDKLEAAETLKSKIFLSKLKHFEIEVIPSLYPHGTDRMLQLRDSGEKHAVLNIASAYAAYEAVVFQKPLIERVVTVGGECLIEPKNIWARMGMDFEAVIKSAKGFLRPSEKILMGGPMAGTALEDLDTSVFSAAQAVLALAPELTRAQEEEPCTRCGLCVETCPAEIHPALITLAAEQGLFELSRDYGVSACVECGNCTYVCPSKRPMAELIRQSLNFGKSAFEPLKKRVRRRPVKK